VARKYRESALAIRRPAGEGQFRFERHEMKTHGSVAAKRIVLALVTLIFACASAAMAADAAKGTPFLNLPLVPSAVAPGSPGFELTVNGAGFSAHSKVKWNGHALATRFLSDHELRASVPAASVAKASTATVTIWSPGGRTSDAAYFEVTKPAGSVSLTGPSLPVGTNPSGIAAGDFNGDGFLDLAVTEYDSGNGHQVAILLGKGDGTFQAPVRYPTGLGPYAVIAADFNHDGKLDLAVSAEFDDSVMVLLGSGDGTFRAQKKFTASTYPHELAAADFDGDGNLDLAINGSSNGFLDVMLGNGDGTFKPDHIYITTWGLAGGVSPSPGDFNGDGKLDLAVLSGEGVGLMLGKGNGDFSKPAYFAAAQVPASEVVADFNGDGKLDVAVAGSSLKGAGVLAVLRGNGDGTFRSHVDYPCSGQPKYMVAADLNGDGKLDLAVTDAATGKVHVFLGKGDGTFQEPAEFDAGGHRAMFLAAGDFNGDGRMDLAVVNADTNSVSVLLGSAQ
jgi:hypothetical protein